MPVAKRFVGAAAKGDLKKNQPIIRPVDFNQMLDKKPAIVAIF